MAFLWLSYDAEGMSVQETATEVKRLFEDDEGNDWVRLTLVTSDEKDLYKSIYVDRTRVLAIEQGLGDFSISEEEEIDHVQ